METKINNRRMKERLKLQRSREIQNKLTPILMKVLLSWQMDKLLSWHPEPHCYLVNKLKFLSQKLQDVTKSSN